MTDVPDELRKDLRRLAGRWRTRAGIFGEGDEAARNVANMCADEVEELIDSE